MSIERLAEQYHHSAALVYGRLRELIADEKTSRLELLRQEYSELKAVERHLKQYCGLLKNNGIKKRKPSKTAASRGRISAK